MTQVKKSILAVATVGIVATGVLGSRLALADTSNKDGLIERISTKFNLNKDDVSKVFSEFRQEKDQQKTEDMNKRLDNAVSSGGLTQEQADKIKQKLAEVKANLDKFREDNKDSQDSDAETKRKEFFKQQFDDLKKWAEDNNIDKKYLMPLGGKGHRGGHMDMDGNGGMHSPDSDDSQQ